MKKHPFLNVDYVSTVKLTPSEQRQLKSWLGMAGEVARFLIEKKIIPLKGIQSIEVSLLLCGNARIRELNSDHRNKDKVTDVLSFPAHEDLRKNKSRIETLFLGDMAICHQQTKKQAKEFGITYWDEFIHLFFHGLIHLMGYDHELSEKEEKLMEKWEKLALEKFSELKKGAR